MKACLCFDISDKEILGVQELADIKTLDELQEHLPVGTSCGRCKEFVMELLKETTCPKD